jgi:hypothetical protein
MWLICPHLCSHNCHHPTTISVVLGLVKDIHIARPADSHILLQSWLVSTTLTTTIRDCLLHFGSQVILWYEHHCNNYKLISFHVKILISKLYHFLTDNQSGEYLWTNCKQFHHLHYDNQMSSTHLSIKRLWVLIYFEKMKKKWKKKIKKK